MPEQFDAIIPAGGRAEGDLARDSGTDVKALIALAGQPILERTVQALRDSGRVRRIVVIGPAQVQAASGGADTVLGEGDSGPANILRGVEWLSQSGADLGRVLVVTSDLPFVTAQAVAHFLDACLPDSQVCVSALKRLDFEAKYPDVRGEYVRLSDGEWTLGCAFVLDGALLLARRAQIEAIFDARKSQWAMARLLGAPFIARWLARRLTTAHILARCEKLLRCRGQLVAPCSPELAFDIDGAEEFGYALKLLG